MNDVQIEKIFKRCMLGLIAFIILLNGPIIYKMITFKASPVMISYPKRDVLSSLKTQSTLNVTNSSIGVREIETVIDAPCHDQFNYVQEIVQPQRPTNHSEWSFREKHHCPPFPKTTNSPYHTRVILSCKDGKQRLSTTQTSTLRDVTSVPHDDRCLKAYIQKCCQGDKLVPNVVHFVYTNTSKEVSFIQFVSFMGAWRFMKPCLFLFHGSLPRGKYWDLFIQLAPNVIHVNRTTVTEVFGQKLRYVEHSADVMRIEALIAFGGYYLDWDELLLRSVEELRNNSCTLSQEQNDYIMNSFIMAQINSTFLNLWLEGYRRYDGSWAHNSLKIPYNIAQKHPELVNIAGYRFASPNTARLDLIFDKNYNWSDNFGIHLYLRFYDKPTNEVIVRTLNTTIGSVCRHILFGCKEICIESKH